MVHTVPYCPTSGFPLNLFSLDFHSWRFLWYHGYYARKATQKRDWNRMAWQSPSSFSNETVRLTEPWSSQESRLGMMREISITWLSFSNPSEECLHMRYPGKPKRLVQSGFRPIFFIFFSNVLAMQGQQTVQGRPETSLTEGSCSSLNSLSLAGMVCQKVTRKNI